MPRAFLSHSSDDKPYVERVASLLGRARAAYDAFMFRPGEDFRAAIRRTLDESDFFVFFVSQASLRSTWCAFEIDEAESRTIQRSLAGGLAILIDDDVDYSDVPAWMAAARAVKHSSPQQSFQEIEALLYAMIPETLQRPFVGRAEEVQRGQRKLSLDDPPPRIVMVSGLAGVGRRSYIRKLAQEALQMRVGPIISLDETRSMEDLYIEAYDAVAGPVSVPELVAELEAFRSLTGERRIEETAQQLNLLALRNQMPCIVDQGVMITNEGRYHAEYVQMIAHFLDLSRDTYLALVHQRHPFMGAFPFRNLIFDRRLTVLESVDIQVLLRTLLRDASVAASPDDIRKLADAVGGYPPAAYQAASLIEHYGLDVVIADGSLLADFKARRFSTFLERLELGEEERTVLRYLASEFTLPLQALAAAADIEVGRAAEIVRVLVDHCLVDRVGAEYCVAGPVEHAVLRSGEAPNKKYFEGVFNRLETAFWSDEDVAPPISVVDATLRAQLLAGIRRDGAHEGLVRASILVRSAQSMYRRKDYQLALQYAERAEAMGERTTTVSELQIKSLAQMGEFELARDRLRDYPEPGDRHHWFLRGFVARRQGRIREAADYFRRASEEGDRSTPLLREFAEVLLQLNDSQEAMRYASEALVRADGNVFLHDLMTRIQIAGGSIPDAEAALQALREVDSEGQFYHRRRALFLLSRITGRDAAREAVEEARRACSGRDAPLEAYFLLANAIVEARDFAQLEPVMRDIDRLAKARPEKIELELKVAVARGRWRQAERLLPRVRDHQRPEIVALRADILDVKVRDATAGVAVRQNASAELAALREELGDNPDVAVIVPRGDVSEEAE